MQRRDAIKGILIAGVAPVFILDGLISENDCICAKSGLSFIYNIGAIILCPIVTFCNTLWKYICPFLNIASSFININMLPSVCLTPFSYG